MRTTHCPHGVEVTDCLHCARVPVSAGDAAAYGYRDAAVARERVDPPRVTVGAVPYVLLGRLARGESCDVLLARRDARLTEQVVVKVPRDPSAPADALAREWRVLSELQTRDDVRGAHFFTTLLPQPVTRGAVRGLAGRYAGVASVFRWRSGFLHTLDDVVCEYPDGVAPQTAVWLWKRTLALLGWVHRAGYVHGAVLPAHVLIHPRDHGAVLVGWSRAVRLAAGATAPLRAPAAAAALYYPREVLAGGAPTPATDIAMSARCVAYVLGGDPASGDLPADVPAPLAALVRAHAADAPPADVDCARSDDAWELMERVGAAGREAFGPPRYHPFRMPGWR